MRASLKSADTKSKLGLVAAVIAAAVVGFVTYLPVLWYPFTGTDTFTLIDTGRLKSVGDLTGLLTKPLMWQSGFMTQGMFYRPVAALSYSFDYLIWGLDPFGYHLTDVCLHVSVALLVAALVWVLTDRDCIAAGAAGILFALHPIIIESVPAPDHRHDVMAAALMIASLLLFLKAVSREGSRKALFLASVVFYVAALGAKEIVIFFPALIFFYCFLFKTNEDFVRRCFRAGLTALPFVAAGMAYVAWRIVVLGSLGGYNDRLPTGDFLTNAGAIVILYFQDLLYPQDYLGIYDLISRSSFIVALLICGAIALWGWSRFPRGDRRPRPGCEDRRLAAFFSFWMIQPLLVCLATMTFSHRSMYIPAVPLSALLSCVFVSGLRRLSGRLNGSEEEEETLGNRRSSLFERAVRSAVFVAGAALIGSLLAASPLVKDYGEWKDSAEMSSLLFKRLSEELPSLPQSVTIHLHGVPSAITGYEDRLPRIRGVGYLNDYSIASWLRLFHPDRSVRVVVHDRFGPERLPSALNLRIKGPDMSNPKITVEFPGMKGRRAPANQ